MCPFRAVQAFFKLCAVRQPGLRLKGPIMVLSSKRRMYGPFQCLESKTTCEKALYTSKARNKDAFGSQEDGPAGMFVLTLDSVNNI